MVLLFIAFAAFAILILGSALAINHDIDDDWGSYPDLDTPCDGDCPDSDGPDGACSVCGFITEPVGSDFLPTGSTPTPNSGGH